MARRILTADERNDILRRIVAGEATHSICARYGIARTVPPRLWHRFYPDRPLPGKVGRTPGPLSKAVRRLRGQGATFTAEEVAKVRELCDAGLSNRAIAEAVGRSRSSIYRYLVSIGAHEQKGRGVARVPGGRGPSQPRAPRPPRPKPIPFPVRPAPVPSPPVARSAVGGPPITMAELRAKLEALKARAPSSRVLPGTFVPLPSFAGPRDGLVEAALTRATGIPQTKAAGLVSRLEANGWRAESRSSGTTLAVIEVRDLRIRHQPLIATLRTELEVTEFLEKHGRGLGTGPVNLTGSVRNANSARTGEHGGSSGRTPNTYGEHWPPRASIAAVALGTTSTED